jgi:hypothetical protein
LGCSRILVLSGSCNFQTLRKLSSFMKINLSGFGFFNLDQFGPNWGYKRYFAKTWLNSSRKDQVYKGCGWIRNRYMRDESLSTRKGCRCLQVTGLAYQGNCSEMASLSGVSSPIPSYCCWQGSSMAMQ